MTDDVLHVRHVLARWRANDWRRAFALAAGLERSLRAACDVPAHEPLTDNTGAVAMSLLRRLGGLDLEDIVQALHPLLEQLARPQQGLPPGLAELADCHLVPTVDVIALDAALDDAKTRAVAGAKQVLADVQAGRPVDLTDLQAWNDRLERVDDVAALRAASLAAETLSDR
jgi:hypothetical protein